MWLVTNVLDSAGHKTPVVYAVLFNGDIHCHFYFKMICNVIHMMKFGRFLPVILLGKNH